MLSPISSIGSVLQDLKICLLDQPSPHVTENLEVLHLMLPLTFSFFWGVWLKELFETLIEISYEMQKIWT